MLLLYIAPCGTIVVTIDIEEGKKVAKFNSITGKPYWSSNYKKLNNK